MAKSGKWSVSYDGTSYRGDFDTRDKAIEEGRSCSQTFWVGQKESPTPPEDFFHADDWLEDVHRHDDYAGDWDNEPDPTKEQTAELQDGVRKVIGWWLDKHALRPNHFNIDKSTVSEFRGRS